MTVVQQRKNQKLLLSSFSVALVRVVGLSANLLFLGFIGRVFGADTVGRYSISYVFLMLGSTLAMQGLQSSIIRFSSGDVALERYELAYKRYHWVLSRVFRNGFVWTLICLTLAWPLSHYVFKDTNSLIFIVLMGGCIIPFAYIQIGASFSQSINKPVLSMMISSVSIPTLGTLMLLPGYLIGWDEWVVPLSYLIACGLLALGVTSMLVLRSSSSESPPITKKQTQEMTFVGWPLLWSSVFGVMLGWADTLMLSAIAGPTEAGIYAMAFRVAIFASLARQIAIKVVLGPFAGAVKLQNIAEQQRLMAYVTHIGLLAIIPIAGIVWLLPEVIMGSFGSEFRAGASILTIVVIGEFISLLFGSPGAAMQVNGQERTFGRIVFWAFFTNVLLNLAFIPVFGGVGAALATVVTSVFQRLIMCYYVKTKTGLLTFAVTSWLRHRKLLNEQSTT